MINPSLRRSAGAVAGLVAAFVLAPAMLILAAQRRFGHASPLQGTNAPWRWSIESARSWWHQLAGGLDTSAELTDLFLRIALLVAWACVVALVSTIVAETVFQLRHGMPSSGRRNLFGIGWFARMVATGLIGLLPFASGTPALASGPATARSVVATQVVAGSMPRVATSHAASSLTERVPAATYRVLRGDSVWSIAARIGGAADSGAVAQQIVEANHGRTMNDGSRFTTAALIEPGWDLLVPSDAGESDGELGAAVHVVVRGDSYWRIAAEALEERDGRPPTDHEIFDYVEVLMDVNVPALGHRNPALILPGEQVLLVPMDELAPGEPSADVPVVADLPTPEVPLVDVPVTTPVDVPVVASSVPVTVVPPPDVADVPMAADAPSPWIHDWPAPSPDVGVTSIPVHGDLGVSAVGHNDGVPVREGLGAVVLLSAGALAVLAARRRQQLRSARVGARLAAPTALQVDTERTLRSLSQPEQSVRLDLALRAAALDIAEVGGRIVSVEVAADGEIRLLPDRPVAPSADVWRLDLVADTWVLPGRVATETLGSLARHAGMPSPALVQLGTTATGVLFVDLEAIGVLCIDAPADVADDIIRCMAAAVRLSPLGTSAHVISVETAQPVGLGDIVADPAATLAEALEAADRALGSTATMARGVNTFALRARSNGAEPWEPAVVFAGPEGSRNVPDHVATRLAGLAAAPGGGLAVVVGASLPGARWTLRSGVDGFVLVPSGVPITPSGLSAAHLAGLESLLASADEHVDVHADVVPLAGPVFATAPFEEPQWTVMVHLLGQVGATSCEGVDASFERSKSLELVVWLSQHRRHSTRTGARTALWDLDVRDATFANVVSDARRALARAVAPPAGEEWLARTLTEDLPLHELVVSDADLLTLRVAHARGMRGAAAADVLRPGLDLVTGMPFSGTSYLWPDAEGITSSLTLLVIGAAVDLANIYLAMGDAEGVFWATGQGLRVLAGHEELISLRMRAHARAGDLAGVRNEWEAYERAISADPWASSQPSPKLVAIRRELLGATIAS